LTGVDFLSPHLDTRYVVFGCRSQLNCSWHSPTSGTERFTRLKAIQALTSAARSWPTAEARSETG
jgi:hypothetical protein